MRASVEHRTKINRHTARRRALITLVLAGLTVLTIAINWSLTTNSNEHLAKAEASHKQEMARLDKQIAEVKAERAAEAKRAAEAARATAEEVLQTEDASSIDASSCNISGKRADPSSPSVMVNKKHCLQPLTYAPSDLVTVYGATISNKAADSWKRLFEAASAAGYPLSVTSSYRSYSNQVSTYQYWASTSGQAGADTYSARPGYSEHQTGFAIDVADVNGCSLDCFGKTPQYQWLQAHAADYGFIQRYYAGSESITGYKAEEWHYRYVGVEVAKDMKAKGIKTLEEYWNMPGGLY